MSARVHHGSPVMVDHTPPVGTNVTAGDMLKIGDQIMIAHRDIEGGVLGALAAPGGEAAYHIDLAAGESFQPGDTVNVDPGLGTAAAGSPHKFGICVLAAAAGDATVYARHTL